MDAVFSVAATKVQEENQIMNVEIAKLHTANNELKDKLAALTTVSNDEKLHSSKLQAKNTELNVKVATLSAVATAEQAEIIKLNEENAALKEKLDGVFKTTVNKVQEENDIMNREMAKLHVENAELKGVMESLSSIAVAEKEEISKLLSEFKVNLQPFSSNIAAEKVELAKLQTENTKLKAKLELLSAVSGTADDSNILEENNSIKVELAKVLSENTELKERLQSLTSFVAVGKAELDKVNSDLKMKLGSLSVVSDSSNLIKEKELLQVEVSRLRQENADLEEKLGILSSVSASEPIIEHSIFHEENEKLRAELKTLLAENAALQEKLKSLSLLTIPPEAVFDNSKISQENEELKSELAKLGAEVVNLKEKVHALSAVAENVEIAEKEMSVLRNERVELKSAFEALNVEKANLISDLDRALKEDDILIATVLKANDVCLALDAAEKELQELKEKHESNNGDGEKLRKQFEYEKAHLNAEIITLKDALLKASEESKIVKSSSLEQDEATIAELARLRTEIVELNEKLLALSSVAAAPIDNTILVLEDAEKEISELKIERDELKTNLETLKSEKSSLLTDLDEVLNQKEILVSTVLKANEICALLDTAEKELQELKERHESTVGDNEKLLQKLVAVKSMNVDPILVPVAFSPRGIAGSTAQAVADYADKQGLHDDIDDSDSLQLNILDSKSEGDRLLRTNNDLMKTLLSKLNDDEVPDSELIERVAALHLKTSEFLSKTVNRRHLFDKLTFKQGVLVAYPGTTQGMYILLYLIISEYIMIILEFN
jgi:chromosome segregation ATPase